MRAIPKSARLKNVTHDEFPQCSPSLLWKIGLLQQNMTKLRPTITIQQLIIDPGGWESRLLFEPREKRGNTQEPHTRQCRLSPCTAAAFGEKPSVVIKELYLAPIQYLDEAGLGRGRLRASRAKSWRCGCGNPMSRHSFPAGPRPALRGVAPQPRLRCTSISRDRGT